LTLLYFKAGAHLGKPISQQESRAVTELLASTLGTSVEHVAPTGWVAYSSAPEMTVENIGAKLEPAWARAKQEGAMAEHLTLGIGHAVSSQDLDSAATLFGKASRIASNSGFDLG
jgi:hypothetical protein